MAGGEDDGGAARRWTNSRIRWSPRLAEMTSGAARRVEEDGGDGVISGAPELRGGVAEGARAPASFGCPCPARLVAEETRGKRLRVRTSEGRRVEGVSGVGACFLAGVRRKKAGGLMKSGEQIGEPRGTKWRGSRGESEPGSSALYRIKRMKKPWS